MEGNVVQKLHNDEVTYIWEDEVSIIYELADED